MDKGPWRGRGRGREKEHGWCFAALSFLIDESGPRGALKANRYFFLPIFFLDPPFCCWLWQNTMAEQNKWWGEVGGCVWRGHPLITSLWGFQRIGIYLCFCRCVCQPVQNKFVGGRSEGYSSGCLEKQSWQKIENEINNVTSYDPICIPTLASYPIPPAWHICLFSLTFFLPTYRFRLLSKQKAKSWLFLCLSLPYGRLEGFGKPQHAKPLHCILLHLPSLTSPLSLSFCFSHTVYVWDLSGPH